MPSDDARAKYTDFSRCLGCPVCENVGHWLHEGFYNCSSRDCRIVQYIDAWPLDPNEPCEVCEGSGFDGVDDDCDACGGGGTMKAFLEHEELKEREADEFLKGDP